MSEYRDLGLAILGLLLCFVCGIAVGIAIMAETVQEYQRRIAFLGGKARAAKPKVENE